MAADRMVNERVKKVIRRIARAADVQLAEDVAALESTSGPEPHLPKLLFVLGSQRSGTNALRRSLSLDPWVLGFNERASDRWYEDWRLKREPELRDDLRQFASRAVLFKPIVNMQTEAVGDWLQQWDRYEVQVAWIYRNPVNVFRSRSKHWPDKGDVDEFLEEWHRVNWPVVDAIDQDGRISLVRYEDLVADKGVFWGLCRRLGVHGENLFVEAPSTGHLEGELVEDILDRTRGLQEELDRRRTFVPADPELVADVSA